MSIIHWEVRSFRQLSVDTFFEVFQLRVDVFVVEQQCAYRELDEFDRHSETRHLSGRNESGELVAYTRILPPGLRYPEANLGRFVVRADSRNNGFGHEMVRIALREISQLWPKKPVKISAQDYLQSFYTQYGFVRVSQVYLEDGIPHVEMVKKP